MNLRIAFWNLAKKSLEFPDVELVIKELGEENDLVILIEAEQVDDAILAQRLGLNRVKPIMFPEKTGRYLPRIYTSTNLIGFVNLNSENQISMQYDENSGMVIPDALKSRLVAFSIEHKIHDFNILFVAVHLYSMVSVNEVQAAADARMVASHIRNLEMKLRAKALIFGDFNMHPYSLGMMERQGFFTSPSYQDVLNDPRRLYNPSYNLLGDYESIRLKRPPGSYYFESDAPKDFLNWAMLDQVLMRKEIAPLFDFSKFRIITQTKSVNLMDEKNHRPGRVSDHFPIQFCLNLEL